MASIMKNIKKTSQPRKISYLILTLKLLIFNLSSLILSIRSLILNRKLLIFNLSSLIFILSCSSPPETNDDTVTFSGTVTLEDTTDFSGVTVALYEPVEPDTAIVRINEQYPNIGVQISQETEFDHREHTPLYTTTTKADGNWKIEGVKKGTYNIVAQKEGWGWEYVLEKDEKTKAEFTLYRETVIDNNFTDNARLKRNHHYIFKNSVSIFAPNLMDIQAGAWLRFESGAKLVIYGPLNITGSPDNYIRFTANSADTTKGQWKYVELNGVKQQFLQYIIIEKNKSGLKLVDCEGVSVSNAILHRSENTGLRLDAADGCIVSNCLFRDNDQSVLAQDAEDDVISRSVFYKAVEGIKLERASIQISNNYFAHHTRGIHAQFRPSALIKHNVFYNNTNGVFIAGSDPMVRANHFENNRESVFIGYEYFSVDAKPVINYNNLLNNQFGIKMIGGQGGSNIHDIDGKYNWWGTVAEAIIKDLIWDKNDIGADSIYVGKIIYSPFSTSIIDTAKILK